MKPVSHAAQLKCSFGTAASPLTVLPTNLTKAGNAPVATIMDCVPDVNVAPFGLCKSIANPQVAAATAANFGRLTPQACKPDISSPWAPPDPRFRLNGLPVLTDACKCLCKWAGTIEVTQPGQTFASFAAGAPGSGSGALSSLGDGSARERVSVPESLELPEGHHVAHQFMCEVTGKPIAGLRWYLRTRRGKTIAEGLTDDNGFAVTEVPTGGGYVLEYEKEPPIGTSEPDDELEAQHA